MENPTLKLHSILEKAFNFSQMADSYTSAWAKVFNINETDNVALMQNISSMINLYNETIKLVEMNERLNIERNLNYLKNVEEAIFSINFNGRMTDFFEALNEETLNSLYFIGEIIGYNYNLTESIVDNEKVAEIIVEVNELILIISESSLPKDVQSILINNLILIKDALDRYRFLGEDELRKALEQTLGSIALNKPVIDKNQDDNVYPRFGGVIGKVSSLITIGTAIKDYLLPFFDKHPIE